MQEKTGVVFAVVTEMAVFTVPQRPQFLPLTWLVLIKLLQDIY